MALLYLHKNSNLQQRNASSRQIQWAYYKQIDKYERVNRQIQINVKN